MGTSDYRKRSYGKSGSTLTLKVLGATADLPLGLQAYGKDCVGDKANKSKEGYFAYLAAPMKKKAVFVHEKTTKEDGTIFHMWKATASKDCPPGRLKVDKMRAINDGSVDAWRGYFDRATDGTWAVYKRKEGEDEADAAEERRLVVLSLILLLGAPILTVALLATTR